MTDLTNRESTLYDLAKQYRASQVRSANENDIRGDIRETVDKLGLDSKAFQDSIRMELELTEGDRIDYVNDLTEMQGILKDRTADLFGEEEARKKAERIKRREDKAAKATGTAPADSPRGDPAKGGAGGVDGTKPAKDAAGKSVEPPVTKRKPGRPKKDAAAAGTTPPPTTTPAPDAAAVAATEQEEGGAILDDHLATMEAGALPEVPGDDDGPAETGDQLIARVKREEDAKLAARGGMGGMAPIDASEPVDNGGNSGNGLTGKRGLGSVADERPLSQSAQAQQKLEAAGLNKPA